MISGRLIASFATAVLLVSGLGYVASQTLTGRPALVEQPASYVAAPAPATAGGGAGRQESRTGPPQVDPQWIARIATAAGIPQAAIRAYATAQLSAPDGCDIGWTTLAGIGWVESQHGTIDGRTLGLDGHSSTPILGPA